MGTTGAPFKGNLEASLRRWRAFWSGEVADRMPLVIRYRQQGDEQGFVTGQAKGNDFAAQLDLDSVAAQARQAETQFAQRADFGDDSVPLVSGPWGMAMMGWLLGCPVRVAAGIPWAEPILADIAEWRQVDVAAVRRRFDRLLEIDRLLAGLSRGRYAVSAAALDGPADMVVRLLGEQKLALALYEQPEEVDQALALCARLWQEFAGKKLAALPPFQGGSATGWDYWAPGRAFAFQEDFAQMLSPRQYRERILLHDSRLAREQEICWHHVHSGGIHMAPELAASGSFRGIQITNDYPAGPSPEQMLPILQRLQGRVCLILRKFSLDQLDRMVGHLSPRGLAIDIQCYDSRTVSDIQTTHMSRAEAEQVLRWAEDWRPSVRA